VSPAPTCSCGRALAREDLVAVCTVSEHVAPEVRRGEFAFAPAAEGPRPFDRSSSCRGCGRAIYWHDRRDLGGGLVPLAVATERRLLCSCLGSGKLEGSRLCPSCAGWGFRYAWTTHYADCPRAAAFKRLGERRKKQ
jgi:hypothetical protein